MIEILDMKDIKDATPEEIAELRQSFPWGCIEISEQLLSPHERTKAQVATGENRRVMKNFLRHA